MKRKGCCGCMIALTCAAAALLLAAAIWLSSFATADSVARFFERNADRLPALADAAKGRFVAREEAPLAYRLWFVLDGLSYVDARDESGGAAFTFQTIHPEESLLLVFCPEGSAVMEDLGRPYSLDFSGGIPNEFYVDGLGVSGAGYVKGRRLDEQWVLVESYLPT